ncbi:hypothetical protein [Hymenobacter sp. B81]|uniref:hypothetical protein n=1 Tax=Hymenobacter sp. B81 TaxID=3344878 RepID=UPI0037DDA649
MAPHTLSPAPAFRPEPGLPWLAGRVLDEAAASGRLDTLRQFAFLGAGMAPAFPQGCIVAMEPVPTPQDVTLGHVYAVTVTECPRYVGRLVEVLTAPYALRLSYDNPDEAMSSPVVIDWHDPAVQLWRVSHYVTLPVH